MNAVALHEGPVRPPGQKHRVHLSQTFTLLGETARAYAAQDQALRVSRAPSLMTRALVAIDRATCRAHDGEREEAAHIATQAYAALPTAYQGGLTRTRALALYRSRPPGTRGREALGSALGVAA